MMHIRGQEYVWRDLLITLVPGEHGQFAMS